MKQALGARKRTLPAVILAATGLILACGWLSGCRISPATPSNGPAQAPPLAAATAPATPLPAAQAPVAPAHPRATGTIAPAAQVRVPILMYHHVRDLPPRASQLESDLTVSPAHFEEHLALLDRLGCNTVTLAQIHAYFAEKRPLPARPICLTFDDGYLDNYTVVFAALQRHGMVGTFFITTNIVGDGDHVTWANLKEMHAAGMEIGSHTKHHFELPGLSDWRVREELVDSRAKLIAEVGGADFFCYPSGRKNDAIVAKVKAAGYKGAVTTEHGVIEHAGEPYTMPRLRVHGTWGGNAFAASLASTAGSEYKVAKAPK